MRKIFCALLLTFVLATPAVADRPSELFRNKNSASRIPVTFPNSSTKALITGATDLNCKCATHTDGANPANLTTNCTTPAPTEIGSSGIYMQPLTADELNVDYLIVLCTTSSASAEPFLAIINTTSTTLSCSVAHSD